MSPFRLSNNRCVTAPVQVGDVIAGKYEIERIVATGGMGVVVAARHCHLEQRFAIKFMLTELLTAPVKPDAVDRFVREGRAAVRLRGENVARVVDVDTLEDGTPYMVMEYLEGQDLAEHLAKHGVLPLSEAVDYVLQACVAMAEAHRSGIIHRDLKPENLFLTRRPDGTPLIKVLDFGISKLFSGENDARRTQTAVVMGSPAYMPPEQVRSSKDVDPRSDVWSLGVILYECTSGQRPFDIDGSTAALLAQVLYEAPRPLVESASYLPQAFCQVVDRCLEKEPGDRYQSVGELASALGPFASDVGRSLITSVHALVGGPSGATRHDPGRPASSNAGPARVAASRPSPADNGGTSATMPQVTVPGKRKSRPVVGHRGQGELQIESLGTESAPALAMNEPAMAQTRAARERLALRKHVAAQQDAKQLEKRVALRRDATSLASLSLVLILGFFTAYLLIRGNGAPLVDAVNAGIHRLGHAASGWAGDTGQLLGGTVLQLLIPGGLAALLLWKLHQWVAAMACVWWLGETLVHIGSYLGDAMYRRSAPIAGDVHVWGYLTRKWELVLHAERMGQVLHWSGVAIMITALALLLRKGLAR